MKRVLLAVLVLMSFSQANAQGIFDRVKKEIKKDSSGSVSNAIGSVLGGSKSGGNLSNEEIISGLKEALSVGAKNSATQLSSIDGFFKNEAIKIIMPDEAKKVEKTLRNLGMSSLVDKAILSMNRAAEDAASGVGNIFLDAIRQMTVQDGLSILRGGDQSATEFLKKSTSQQLLVKMKPVIEASLNKVNATAYWKDVFGTYNKVSPSKVNPDLSAYVTEKAMDGLFYSIGQEELKIRKDPAARVTDLLKKVFAN